ncbi:MAG: hypothetical protein MJ120_00620 [Clostridia bacterium]|nr:hypothetical protein [Clostridia bacterium]
MKKLSKIVALVLCLIMIMSTGSALFISAQAASTQAVSAPKFSFEQTSKSGNTVTYEIKLKSGGFNSLDCRFVVSTGVTCTAIKFADGVTGGVANPKTAKISYANVDTYSKAGTVATATFTVPSSGSYSINLDIQNCAVSNGNGLTDVTKSVSVEGASTSWFARLIAAIVSFFRAIGDFFRGLAG